MEIKCTACGKEIAPLELYDGTWSCPNCRSLLIDQQPELKITKENEELFRQGEILYSQWLFNRNGRIDYSIVEKAIKLCRIAARQGNPRAIARLGYYYDKDYIGSNFTEAMRVKLAYSYYSQVCFNGLAEIATEPGAPAINWHEARKKTAMAMLFMLSQAPAEIRESPMYNLQNNLERVRTEIAKDINISDYVTTYYKLSAKERFFSTILSCTGSYRAPLFGAFRLYAEDITDLNNPDNNRVWPDEEEGGRRFGRSERKCSTLAEWLANKNNDIYIYYIKTSDLNANRGSFKRLGTSDTFTAFANEVEPRETVWVFFFNYRGGHKYLSRRGQRNKVHSVLYSNKIGATPMLKAFLKNSGGSSRTFYDDDIYQFSKQKSFAEATRLLIEQVISVGGNE